MGVASLVLGIICILVAFIPVCNWFVALPALIGFILGLVNVCGKKKPDKSKGPGIAGLILNILSLLAIVGWLIIMLVTGAFAEYIDTYDNVYQNMTNNYDYNDVYDYDYNDYFNY